MYPFPHLNNVWFYSKLYPFLIKKLQSPLSFPFVSHMEEDMLYMLVSSLSILNLFHFLPLIEEYKVGDKNGLPIAAFNKFHHTSQKTLVPKRHHFICIRENFQLWGHKQCLMEALWSSNWHYITLLWVLFPCFSTLDGNHRNTTKTIFFIRLGPRYPDMVCKIVSQRIGII